MRTIIVEPSGLSEYTSEPREKTHAHHKYGEDQEPGIGPGSNPQALCAYRKSGGSLFISYLFLARC